MQSHNGTNGVSKSVSKSYVLNYGIL